MKKFPLQKISLLIIFILWKNSRKNDDCGQFLGGFSSIESAIQKMVGFGTRHSPGDILTLSRGIGARPDIGLRINLSNMAAMSPVCGLNPVHLPLRLTPLSGHPLKLLSFRRSLKPKVSNKVYKGISTLLGQSYFFYLYPNETSFSRFIYFRHQHRCLSDRDCFWTWLVRAYCTRRKRFQPDYRSWKTLQGRCQPYCKPCP